MITIAKILSIFSFQLSKKKTRQVPVSPKQDASLDIVSTAQIEDGRSSAYRRLIP